MSDEQVSQFMSFTGSADPAQAASYLEMSGGNIETAVGLFMEHQGGGGIAVSGGAGGAGAGVGGGLAEGTIPPEDIRAPDATRTMRLMDDEVGHNPHFQLMNAMMDEQLAQSAFAALPPPSRNARDVVNAAAAEESKGEGEGDDDEYEYDDDGGENEDEDTGNAGPPTPARLSDMFAPPTHLMHKAGGFQGARSMAKDSKRWLLVNLQRDSEFSCHALNRDVWRDELVENLVREGFIFWQAMDISNEGRTYSERYQVHDYPHLSIIDPRTGRLLWRKEGWTQENAITADSFAEIAMDFCSRNSFDRPPSAPRPQNTVNAVSRPTKRPMHQMSEDEQLQAAMKASMEKDSKSESQDQEMADGDDNDDKAQVIDAADMKPAAVKVEDKEAEEESGSNFLEELKCVQVDDEPANGARLQLRMPDGKRKVRKFAATDSVRNIYAFLAQTVEEASGGREFTLMAGFPPRDLLADLDGTIESCKLSGEAITMRWK